MANFKNSMKINKIMMNKDVVCYCPLGKDFYTNNFIIEMEPNDIICDYCDVELYINSLEKGSYSIEQAVASVYNYLIINYNPKNLIVSSKVFDATHFPVEVTKNMEVNDEKIK